MKILALLFIFILSSCKSEQSNEVVSLSNYDSEYSTELFQLVNKNDQLQDEFSQQIILLGATNLQRRSFSDFLVRSRRELILLLQNSYDQRALDSLKAELERVKGEAFQVRDLVYINNYLLELGKLIESFYIIQGRNSFYSVNFTKASLDDLLFIKGEFASEFSPRTNDFGEYLSVDSFRNKNDGVSKVITPIVKLDKEALNFQVEFRLLTRFYNAEAREKGLIKFFVGANKESVDDIDWIELDVVIGPDAASFNEPPSSTQLTDINVDNDEIRFLISYESRKDDGFFPALNIYGLKIKDKDD
tara:strand:+ start:1413 stop:2321 length:909 start_codon:yes stop_codon:yes gene_type:complete